jgi:hypothetical protein
VSTLRRVLEWPGRMIWRSFIGKEMDGRPRTDATWLAEGTTALDPATAPRPPRTLIAEIRSDIARIREEYELRRIARRASAEHQQRSEDDGEGR